MLDRLRLADLRQQDIAIINESMNRCMGYIDHIDALLKVSLNLKGPEERKKLNFSFPVTSIENEQGYLIF